MALAAILLSFATTAKAQTATDSMDVSFTSIKADSVADNAFSPIKADSVYKVKRDWSTWRPNPKRAMWLAIVLPGAGQIYNRKYWKLPIVYGGFVGCIYAMRWNNQMYTDYSQAYLDLMDDDPNTQSYNQFLHLGAKIDESNIQRYQTLFKSAKTSSAAGATLASSAWWVSTHSQSLTHTSTRRSQSSISRRI